MGGGGGALAQGVQAATEASGELSRRHGPACRPAYLFYRAEDAVQVERGEGENASAELLFMHGAMDLAFANGADVAEGLGDEEVRLEPAEEGDIHGVGGATGLEERGDGGVDFAGRAAGRRDGGGGHAGEGLGRGG